MADLQKFRCQVRSYKDIEKSSVLTIEARDEEDAANQLQKDGYIIVSIQNLLSGGTVSESDVMFPGQKTESQLHDRKTAALFLSQGQKKKGRGIQLFSSVGTQELISFAVQLSSLLEAGIPLVRALQIIRKAMKNHYFDSILEHAVDKVSQGFSFSNAITAYPKVFSPVWVHLIEVGETSGKLASGLKEISHYQEAAQRIKSKVISAFFYPTILLVFATCAVTFLMLKIIPKFEEIFKSFHVKLPVITKWVIFVSMIIRSYFPFLAAGVFLLVVFIGFARRKPKGRFIFDQFRLNVPIMGQLMLEVSIVRFARACGTLIRAGIPLLQALEITSKLVQNAVIEDMLLKTRQAVQAGHPLGAELAARKVFPIFMTQLVSIGEETGEIDRFLDVVSNYYEERVDTFLNRLSTLLEPLLLIFMGAVIGVLVIAMFLPIVEISTGGH